MRILHLALKDLRQIVRDRKSFLFLLVMPIIFTVMFGFAFRSMGEEEDPRLPVTVVDEDDTFLSRQLPNILAGSDLVRLQPLESGTDQATALAEETIVAAMTIPAGFGEAFQGPDPLPLQMVVDPGSDAATPVQQAAQAALTRLQSAVRAGQIAAAVYEEEQSFASTAARQQYVEETVNSALAAWSEPPVSVVRDQAGIAPEETAVEENPYANTSPGMMAQFAIAGLISAAEILVLERRTRALARLQTTAISRAEILVGHFLAMFITIFLQIIILVLFGQLVLGLDYLSAPSATLLLAVAAATFTAALGLLIGVLAQSEEQVIIYALIPMFLLSALGGAWMPLEFTPVAFQQVGSLTPVAWMIGGFKDITIRGLGLGAVWPAILVLAGYAVVTFFLATWRFQREG